MILILHLLVAIGAVVHPVIGGVKAGLQHLGGVEDKEVEVGVNRYLHCLGQEV